MDQANIPLFLPVFVSADLDLLGCHALVATYSKVLSMSKGEELLRLRFGSLECFDFQLATYSKYKAKDPLNSCSIFSIYTQEILPVLNYFTFPCSSSSTAMPMTPSMRSCVHKLFILTLTHPQFNGECSRDGETG